MGKQEIVSKQNENGGVEAYGKIFEGVLLLSHKRESRDMMLNNDTSSERPFKWKETKKKREGFGVCEM